MIFLRRERAPVGQNSVPNEFVHDAVVFENDFRHCSEVVIQQRNQLLRIRLLRHGRKITHIGNQNRQLAFISLQMNGPEIGHHIVDQLRRDVTFQNPARLPQFAPGSGIAADPRASARHQQGEARRDYRKHKMYFLKCQNRKTEVENYDPGQNRQRRNNGRKFQLQYSAENGHACDR